MHISSFKPDKNDLLEDVLEEKEIREDLECLTVDDFIDAFISTLRIDSTIDEVIEILDTARRQIQLYKNERICELLYMEHPRRINKEKPLEVKA